nr:uncharacterized protein LOC106836618 isoform X6 [Equus asinus]
MKAVTSSWRDFTHHVPFEAVRSTAQSAARSPVRIPAAVPWPSPRFPAGDPAAGTGRDRPTARLLRPASSPASALLPLLHLRSASRYSKPCDSGSCDSRQSGAAGERQLREAESLYVTKLGRDGDRSQTTVRGVSGETSVTNASAFWSGLLAPASSPVRLRCARLFWKVLVRPAGMFPLSVSIPKPPLEARQTVAHLAPCNCRLCWCFSSPSGWDFVKMTQQVWGMA